MLEKQLLPELPIATIGKTACALGRGVSGATYAGAADGRQKSRGQRAVSGPAFEPGEVHGQGTVLIANRTGSGAWLECRDGGLLREFGYARWIF